MTEYVCREYSHDDCVAYKEQMTVDEVIAILDDIEDRWIGSRPQAAYCPDKTCSELEFGRLQACYALDKAAVLLRDYKQRTTDWIERNKDTILRAGKEGREVEFRIGGRLFAIREMAQ